jgi:hypothetical protein
VWPGGAPNAVQVSGALIRGLRSSCGQWIALRGDTRSQYVCEDTIHSGGHCVGTSLPSHVSWISDSRIRHRTCLTRGEVPSYQKTTAGRYPLYRVCGTAYCTKMCGCGVVHFAFRWNTVARHLSHCTTVTGGNNFFLCLCISSTSKHTAVWRWLSFMMRAPCRLVEL